MHQRWKDVRWDSFMEEVMPLMTESERSAYAELRRQREVEVQKIMDELHNDDEEGLD